MSTVETLRMTERLLRRILTIYLSPSLIVDVAQLIAIFPVVVVPPSQEDLPSCDGGTALFSRTISFSS